MLYSRYIVNTMIERIKESNKAILIFGARQVGKTTLALLIIKKLGLNTLSINADELRYLEVLSSQDSRKLNELVEGYDLLFIDEAQKVPNIGLNLKILIDSNPNIKIIATGSSSFELANKTHEALTGRKWIFNLFPISVFELTNHYNKFELKQKLEELLIWGSYPELLNLKGNKLKEEYLRLLVSDYLFRDILQLSNIQHPEKLHKLLRLLSFQIGNQVSLNELATSLEMSKETVARYLDLLEKSFIIFKLTGFSKNLRKEVTKTNKYYFYDIGIRNILIENLNDLSTRNDAGYLWENFLILERMKKNAYTQQRVSSYFWRTYTGAEIDYVEEHNGKLFGFECKYNTKIYKAPKTWLTEYKNSSWQLINQKNWLDFIT